MTTIRRTLSPVPRAGTVLGVGGGGGEASSVASPLSKCSSCNHDYTPPPPPPPPTNSSFEFALYRFQSLLLSLFSKRASRSLEKHKPRPNPWRRSLFHFIVCFLVGVFVGFTPIVSVENSTNLVSRNQDFPFDQFGKVQMNDVVSRMEVVETVAANNVSSDLEGQMVQAKRENETLDSVPEMGVDKFLIIVTPTYPRMFQAYYLKRLAHTLKLVRPPLLWIVVETTSQSSHTSELLRRSGVMYRHLVCTKNTTEVKDSRVHQRNVALLHIETHRFDGIVYFADDTNIYSTQLFDHMRQIKRFGTWPVAKLKKNTRVATFAGPICNGTQVIGWHTNNVMRRFLRFHADLSGFAFNSTILWDPKKWHRPTNEPIRQLDTVKDGFEVSSFIEQVVEDETEMEGIPEDCSKVLVWHAPMDSSHSSPIRPQEWSFNANLDANLPFKTST